MTGIMCAAFATSSAGGGSDTQTVNVGAYSNVDKYISIYTYGYSQGTTTGTITDGTFNLSQPTSGATITDLNWTDSSLSGTYVAFVLSGTYNNAGFTTMTVNGTPFSRSSASFSVSGGVTTWTWSTGTNPFGTTPGVNRTVNFT